MNTLKIKLYSDVEADDVVVAAAAFVTVFCCAMEMMRCDDSGVHFVIVIFVVFDILRLPLVMSTL